MSALRAARGDDVKIDASIYRRLFGLALILSPFVLLISYAVHVDGRWGPIMLAIIVTVVVAVLIMAGVYLLLKP